MADSPAHRFGQIIGNTLEDALEPRLRKFTDANELYLDRESSDRRRSGKTVRWDDAYGNTHKLDYVIEEEGTVEERGDPIAFIEVAWRRYTKHSKNKAQEIQGAIRPLVEKYNDKAPFSGVVIAGEFTNNAVKQLESLGFSVLYFEYDTITEAFAQEGIDAYWEEDTPEDDLRAEVNKWEALSEDRKHKIAEHLINLNQEKVEDFFTELEATITRDIKLIRVLPLSGTSHDFETVEDAVNYIQSVDEDENGGPVLRYEVQIRYDNRDEITGEFSKKKNAIKFLKVTVESQSSLDRFET
jgi:hypothetical protein